MVRNWWVALGAAIAFACAGQAAATTMVATFFGDFDGFDYTGPPHINNNGLFTPWTVTLTYDTALATIVNDPNFGGYTLTGGIYGASVEIDQICDLHQCAPNFTDGAPVTAFVLSHGIYGIHFSITLADGLKFDSGGGNFAGNFGIITGPGPHPFEPPGADLSPTAAFSNFYGGSPYSGIVGESGVFTGEAFLLRASITPSGASSAPVPEPATWALMILGLGAAGAMIRRRGPSPARSCPC